MAEDKTDPTILSSSLPAGPWVIMVRLVRDRPFVPLECVLMALQIENGKMTRYQPPAWIKLQVCRAFRPVLS